MTGGLSPLPPVLEPVLDQNTPTMNTRAAMVDQMRTVTRA